jgi:CheY-like chemotaxis protein
VGLEARLRAHVWSEARGNRFHAHLLFRMSYRFHTTHENQSPDAFPSHKARGLGRALRAILATDPCFEIVGDASDGGEAVLAVAQLKPAVVVMDINMPRLNGIEATAWIRRTYPHVVVVGVSAIATEHTCQLMKWAGATTVISKDAVEQLRHVILESVAQRSQVDGCKGTAGLQVAVGHKYSGR